MNDIYTGHYSVVDPFDYPEDITPEPLRSILAYIITTRRDDDYPTYEPRTSFEFFGGCKYIFMNKRRLEDVLHRLVHDNWIYTCLDGRDDLFYLPNEAQLIKDRLLVIT